MPARTQAHAQGNERGRASPWRLPPGVKGSHNGRFSDVRGAVMRPRGEVYLALLDAAHELATPDRGATLREMALRACVGLGAARYTVSYMRKSGVLTIARTRRVTYRNRPVAEYIAPVSEATSASIPSGVSALLSAWHSTVTAGGKQLPVDN